MQRAHLILAAHELSFVIGDVYRFFYEFASGVYKGSIQGLCCVEQRVVDWFVVRYRVRAYIYENEGTVLTLEVWDRRETSGNRCFGVAVVIIGAGGIQYGVTNRA